MREGLSQKYLSGYGIEIGGLHNPLWVPNGVHVKYVDRMSLADLQRTADVKPVANEIIVDDAETLATFKPESQDFIIANHVLEHCRSPITALFRWRHVLKPGGIIYAAIPEKTKTFDRDRRVTPLTHILNDACDFPDTYDDGHYREWFSLIDKMSGQVLEDKVVFSVAEKTNIHFHVWNRAAMDEMFHWLKDHLEVLEVGDNGAEIIWSLRKIG